MRFFTPPPIPEKIVLRMRALHDSGTDQQELIRQMRASGLHIGECIKLTRDLNGISLGEAKKIVHFSHAWADLLDQHESFHDSFIRASETLGADIDQEPESVSVL